jgi:hypothetical protein
MNGRRLFRKYAQSTGHEAKEFVRVDKDSYNGDLLITKDNNGNEERTRLNYEEMVHWMIKNIKTNNI